MDYWFCQTKNKTCKVKNYIGCYMFDDNVMSKFGFKWNPNHLTVPGDQMLLTFVWGHKKSVKY